MRLQPQYLRAKIAAGLFTKGIYQDAFGEPSYIITIQGSVVLTDKLLAELERTEPKAETFCDAVEIAALDREADALADDAAEWQARAETAEAQVVELQARGNQTDREKCDLARQLAQVERIAGCHAPGALHSSCPSCKRLSETEACLAAQLEWGNSMEAQLAKAKAMLHDKNVELAQVREEERERCIQAAWAWAKEGPCNLLNDTGIRAAMAPPEEGPDPFDRSAFACHEDYIASLKHAER
jgi:hypothetical protein